MDAHSNFSVSLRGSPSNQSDVGNFSVSLRGSPNNQSDVGYAHPAHERGQVSVPPVLIVLGVICVAIFAALWYWRGPLCQAVKQPFCTRTRSQYFSTSSRYSRVADDADVEPNREDEIFSQLSKLYSFDGQTWVERGLGDAKLLKNTTTGNVRFMMRQEKTMKVLCNHLVVNAPPYCELLPSANADPCWIWTAQDFADDGMKVERFALKLSTSESATAFKDAFELARQTTSARDVGNDCMSNRFNCSRFCGWPCGMGKSVLELEQDKPVLEDEHEEHAMYSQSSKLYSFDGQTWVERRLGDAKLLKDTKTGNVRFMMRQEKTMKVLCNHLVVNVPPYCELLPSANADPCWVWTAQDFADDGMKVERFALKLSTSERATAFKDAFELAKQQATPSTAR